MRNFAAAAVVIATTLVIAAPSQADPYTGTITVEDASTSAVIGYVSNQFNSFGEYVVTNTPADYLNVSFNSGSAPFSITENNNSGSSSHPYVGGIDGFANTNTNIGPGSYNYAYLGGTDLTASGAEPSAGGNTFTDATAISEDIESSLWSVPTNGILAAQWINSDDSMPTTYIEDLTGILLLTGDPTAFADTFGSAELVKLVVPGATAPSTAVPEPFTLSLFGAGLAGAAALRRRRKKKVLA